MTDCKHRNLRSWFWKDSGESAGMWSCVECGRKFVPLDIEQEQDAERYQWLRNDFSVSSLDIDANHTWSYRRNFSLRGPSLNEAIDAAMKLDAQQVQLKGSS